MRPRVLWWHRAEADPATLIAPADQERLRLHADLAVLGNDGRSYERAEAVAAASVGAQVVISSWGAPLYTDEVLAGCPDIRLFVRVGGSLRVGYTDDAALQIGTSAWARGIKVCTTVDAQGQLLADLVLALILAGLHQFPSYVRHQWGVSPLSRDLGPAWPQRTLHTKTVGLYGFGAIGRHTARLLAPWECHKLAYDPYVGEEHMAALGVTRVGSLGELCARSDVLAVLVPYNAQTVRSIGAAELARLPDGALIVHISVGEIVDLAALRAELERGRLFACFDNPPSAVYGHPERLRYTPGFMLTPSISGASDGVPRLMGRQAVDEVIRFLHGEPLQFEVRVEQLRTRA